MVAIIDQHLGKRITLARDQRGLTLAEVAVQMDVSIERLTEFEQGAVRIPALFVARLTRVLNVTPAWLFNGLPGQDRFDRAG
mmetsp:Transcript_18977/g.22814  ORF Transcript_18977/g.22814 Transcript_18977/m.22814 type:complete len:82 (+) Transcript_18977:751-996(+)